MSPRLIAIAGPSCSGKTTLARHLAQHLPGKSLLLSLDSYYRDLSHLPLHQRHHFNFDLPEAIDRQRLFGNLRDLARGRAVEKPIYLFPDHVRAPQGERAEPGDRVILEGLFALYWEDIRSLCHLCLFVEADDWLCLERRLARDTAERGRTRESILEQYTHQVRPMFEKHVLPTRALADLVLDGALPVEQMALPVMARLR